MTLGHEWAGTVVEMGAKTTKLKVGDRVAVVPGAGDGLKGFAQYAPIAEDHCFLISDDIDLKKAFLEPMKCIITVLRASAPEAGDYGLVMGCGPMGMWCIQALAGKYLAGLIAVDIVDDKLELAQKYGATHVINSKTEDLEERVKEITGGHMVDFAIEGTGIPAVLELTARTLRTGRGRLVLMSYHESKAQQFDFRIFSDLGIQMYNPHPRYSLDQLEDARRAVLLINNHTFVQDDLLTHKFTLDQIQEAFDTLENKPKGYMKGVVYPND